MLEGHLVIDARHVTLNVPILRLKNGRANQISTLKGHSTRPYPMCARTGLNCSGSLPYLAWITFCLVRRRSIACRGRDREQGPRRQEEDGGADQALPGRPPAAPQLAKITSHILQLNKSWRAARRLGGGRAGPGRRRRLPPASSVLVRGLSHDKLRNAVAPYFTFRLRSHCVKRCLPRSSCVIRCLPNTLLTCRNVPLPVRFSLSGQRSYAYVMRAEDLGTRPDFFPLVGGRD